MLEPGAAPCPDQARPGQGSPGRAGGQVSGSGRTQGRWRLLGLQLGGIRRAHGGHPHTPSSAAGTRGSEAGAPPPAPAPPSVRVCAGSSGPRASLRGRGRREQRGASGSQAGSAPRRGQTSVAAGKPGSRFRAALSGARARVWGACAWEPQPPRPRRGALGAPTATLPRPSRGRRGGATPCAVLMASLSQYKRGGRQEDGVRGSGRRRAQWM